MKYLKNQLVLLSVLIFAIACSSQQLAEQRASKLLLNEDISNVFYFDFDESEIKPGTFADLDAHSEYVLNAVAEDSNFQVTIVGHCDERGTIDYNFALGIRRAEAVARYLRVKGVSPNNIEVVSYGEEKPVAEGSNENAWSQNRRAVITY